MAEGRPGPFAIEGGEVREHGHQSPRSLVRALRHEVVRSRSSTWPAAHPVRRTGHMIQNEGTKEDLPEYAHRSVHVFDPVPFEVHRQ